MTKAEMAMSVSAWVDRYFGRIVLALMTSAVVAFAGFGAAQWRDSIEARYERREIRREIESVAKVAPALERVASEVQILRDRMTTLETRLEMLAR